MERDGDASLQEADRLFDDGKYEDALAMYERVIAGNESGADALLGKADCLQRLDRHVDAISWYDKALDADEEDDLIWNGKAVSLFHLGEYGQAKLAFEVARDLDPANMDYLLSAVEMAMLCGDLGEAIDMARRALDEADDTANTVLAWAFSIVILVMDNKIVNAIDTTRAFLSHLHGLESDLIPENDYRGKDYDFSGLERAVETIPACAGKLLVEAIVAYLKGDMELAGLDARFDAGLDTMQATCDVPVPSPAPPSGDDHGDYPDIDTIADPDERAGIAIIDHAIDDFEGQAFMSFEALFSMYDWNADRGPAPFVVELDNRFYIDIDEKGKVRRIALDLDILDRALAARGIDVKAARGSSSAGSLIRCPSMEDVYLSASSLATIVDAMRAASFGGREVSLYLKVDKTDDQRDLLALDQAPEAWEIDEISPDFQETGSKIVGSLVWSPGGARG